MPDRKRTLLLAGLLALLGYGSRAEAEARSEARRFDLAAGDAGAAP